MVSKQTLKKEMVTHNMTQKGCHRTDGVLLAVTLGELLDVPVAVGLLDMVEVREAEGVGDGVLVEVWVSSPEQCLGSLRV